ncbi:MAG: hypothetical protein CMM48_01275 [Rhodospirillaceae bacterium]|nr:hypothetical protein [Rhodospirillaceae bacterium]HAA92262.1 hypothetical protein [Rhodospirillaceae bacterium]
MEKLGIPCATVCTDEFFGLGKGEAECLGMPGLPIALVPHPVAELDPPRVKKIAADAADEISRYLQDDAVALADEAKARQVAPKSNVQYDSLFECDFNAPGAPETFDGPDDFAEINRDFYYKSWTDGLPIVPPTPELWKKMLNGRDPDEQLGLVDPGLGMATIGNIAANAVMAGCDAMAMPTLIAAVKGLTDEKLNLKALQSTTHPCTVAMVINGPAALNLGMNAGTNAMGQGNKANATLGRALRLIMTNVGGGVPGVLDRSQMGSPAKYGFCFPENEEANPWQPLHVDQGHGPDESAVTLFGCEGPHNVNDHYGETGEAILTSIASVMSTTSCNNSKYDYEYLVALGAEHAGVIAEAGFSKQDVKEFLFEKCVIPRELISDGWMHLYEERQASRIQGPGGKDGVKLFSSPDQVVIIVAGGAGRHSACIPTFGNTQMVTVGIE